MIDVRNYGLMGAVELEAIAGEPGARGMDILQKAFEAGLMMRITGDILAFSPPLIIEQSHLQQTIDTLKTVLGTVK